MEATMYPGSFIVKPEPEAKIMLAAQPMKLHPYPPMLTAGPTTQFVHDSQPAMMMHTLPPIYASGPTTELVHTSQPHHMFPHAHVLKTEPTTEVVFSPQPFKVYAYPSPFVDGISGQVASYH